MNTTTRPLQDTGQPLSTFESLSALCDGALDPDELGALMQNCQRDAQSLERWHAWLDERGFASLHSPTGTADART